MRTYPLIPSQTQDILFDALHYMNMAELQQSCRNLALPASGKKAELITRIMTFLQTGIIVSSQAIPAPSRATNHAKQPLASNALMLYGSYKNDAQTRAFFKQLIGPHFHFTAFGIDWLTNRWHQGNPPTYQEFADFWHQETEHRKKTKAQPKQEWALINFLQKASTSHPNASQAELMQTWKKLRAEKAAIAQKIMKHL